MTEDDIPPKDDPHADEPPYLYECVDCGERTEAESQPGECPEGGESYGISANRARDSRRSCTVGRPHDGHVPTEIEIQGDLF